MNPDQELKGTVLEIQRMSTEDGPGIRTTVFFKGCPLRCAWCHNPESISPRPQLQWIGSRCIDCGTCRDVCPNNALFRQPEGVAIDRGLCQGCGLCAEACPSTALELLGRKWTVSDLVKEVAKDKVYFEKSGGGVTASGGEAALQAEFAAAFLAECRNAGLSTALDTSGCCSREDLNRLLPAADLMLFDLKLIDPDRHREFTGSSNELILENLSRVRDWMKSNLVPRELWIRTPVIPGATDDPENITGLGRFIARNLKGVVSRWDLCAFNNLCRDKYIRLGRDWAFKDRALFCAAEMEDLAETARSSGVKPEIVHWSGPTRLEAKEEPAREESPRLRLVKNVCPV
ncbi:MAG: glycyl-radical enzyme activating protein [Thermodesulfobacteriota bacterium]